MALLTRQGSLPPRWVLYNNIKKGKNTLKQLTEGAWPQAVELYIPGTFIHSPFKPDAKVSHDKMEADQLMLILVNGFKNF